MPWLPVGGQRRYETGALGVTVVAVTTVLLAAAVPALPGSVRGRVVVLALPMVGLALLHNVGVLCLLVAPFAGLGLVRLRRRATLT
ncbi:hypothetical protein AB0J82_07530 [Asanoa sp. NPDC049518]|uniref:hypothetical protein n=1 Tax=unclassified Asanoa TaxID=2685164 RepID=UPI003428B868